MKRIQRKRIKGWKMPANAVYVGRPSKYENPYKVTSFSLKIKGMDRENAIRMYEGWLSQKLEEDPHFLDELQGKDLACWCPLDKPCHADILLKFLEERVKVCGFRGSARLAPDRDWRKKGDSFKMTKASLQDKANAYMRLYSFLRCKHPEVLELLFTQEFRKLMKDSKDRAIGICEASE